MAVGFSPALPAIGARAGFDQGWGFAEGCDGAKGCQRAEGVGDCGKEGAEDPKE